MRRAIFGVLVLIVAMSLAAWQRDRLVHFVLTTVLAHSLGDGAKIGAVQLDGNRLQLKDVLVTRRMRPVLSASSIDIAYSLRDLLPGSQHRFGVRLIVVSHAQFTIIRFADGSLTIPLHRAGSAPILRAPIQAPLVCNLRIIDSGIRIVDDRDHATQSLVHLNATIALDSSQKSTFQLHGVDAAHLNDRLVAQGVIDQGASFAAFDASIPSLRVNPLLDVLIGSQEVRFPAGKLHDIRVRAGAFSINDGMPTDLSYSVTANAQRIKLTMPWLVTPITEINGPITIVDSIISTQGLHAVVAGARLRVGGVLRFGDQAHVALRVNADGELASARHALSYLSKLPLSGRVTLGLDLRGLLNAPHLAIHVLAPAIRYGGFPIKNVQANLAIENGQIIIARFAGNYHGNPVRIRGSLVPGDHLISSLFLHTETTGEKLPYLSRIVPHQDLRIDAVADGIDENFRGTTFVRNPSDSTVVLVQNWPNGRLRAWPLWIRNKNGSLEGAFTMDRQAGKSAAWITSKGMIISDMGVGQFPELGLPELPFAGHLDAAFALATHGRQSGLAGQFHLKGGQIGSMASQDIRATASGSLQTLAIDPAEARFPWGTFHGRGILASRNLQLAGIVHADLARLPVPAGFPALDGVADGPIRIGIGANGLQLGASALTLRAASLAGIPIESASGAITFGNNGVRIDRLIAGLAGGMLVLGPQSPNGSLSFVAQNVNVARLGPFSGATGRLSAFGSVPSGNFQNANFTAALSNGTVAGYRVDGSALVTLHGSELNVADGLGRLNGMPGAFQGRVWGLGAPTPSYDVMTHVPAADLADVAQAFGVSSDQLSGTFRSDLHVTGRGSNALIDGPVSIPISTVFGQAVHDARGTLVADQHGVTVIDGKLRVGSTRAKFYALSHPAISSLAIVAPSAHLADFNDLFDAGDVLHGDGSIDVSLLSSQHRISTDGNIDIHHLQYHRFPFGHTTATWTSSRQTISGTLAVQGKHGHFDATGSLNVVPTARVERLLRLAHYDATLHAKDLDLSLYRTLMGGPMVPLLGTLDGTVSARGRFPNLDLQADALLHNGSFGATPIDNLTMSVTSSGSVFHLTRAQLSAVGLNVDAAGTFGLEPTSPLALTIGIHAAHIGDVVTRSTHRVLPISGAVDSTILVRGTTASPSFAGAVDGENLHLNGILVPSLIGSADLKGSQLQLHTIEANFGKLGSITLAGTLPLHLAPFSIGNPSDHISFDLAVDKFKPAVFAPLLGSSSELGGEVNGRIGLSGQIGSPRAVGELRLVDGSYSGPYNATSIGQISAQALFSGTNITLSSLRAMIGGGLVTAGGTIDLANGLNSPGNMPYSAHVAARGARLDLRNIGRGSIDASVTLTHTASSRALLAGQATISDASVPFAAFLAPAGLSNGRSPMPLDFDLALRAGQNVRVVGSGYGAGLDIAGTGQVHLRGSLDRPTLAGSFVATSGTLTYLDRSFSVVRARVSFSRAQGLVPNLDALAQTRVTQGSLTSNPFGATEISATLTGPIDHLTFDLESNPPGYTRDQLLAMLTPLGGLTGMTGLSTSGHGSGGPTIGQEAFNLVNAQFTSALLGPLGTAIGKSLGLGNVGFSFDYLGNLSLSVNRPIGRGFSASYSSTFGLVSTQTIGVEYAPNPSTIAQLAFYTTRVAPSIAAGLQPTYLGPNGALFVPQQSGSGFSFTLRRLFGWKRSSKEQPPLKRTGPPGL